MVCVYAGKQVGWLRPWFENQSLMTVLLCFTKALSAWFSWCVSQLLGPRLLSIVQMLPWSWEGKIMSLSDRPSTIGQVLISGSLTQIETTQQALKFKIIWLWSQVAESWVWLKGYNPCECWGSRAQGREDPAPPWDYRIPLPQLPGKSFLFRSTLLCHPNGHIQAAW